MLIRDMLASERALVATSSVAALNEALYSECNRDNTPFLQVTLRNRQDVNALQADTKLENGKMVATESLFMNIIRNGGVLLIDYAGTDAKYMMELHELFDKPPKFKGVLLHEDVKIIGAIKSFEDADNAVLSRSNADFRFEGQDIKRQPVSSDEQKPVHIDLFGHPDWKSMLLGQYRFEGKQVAFSEGPLLLASLKKTALSISGLDWSDPFVQRFFTDMTRSGGVTYNGKEYSLDFANQIVAATEPDYVELWSRHTVSLPSEKNENRWLIHSRNTHVLSKRNKIEKGQNTSLSGLLEDKDAILYIAEDLPPHVWKEIACSSVKHRLEIAPNVEKPDFLSDEAWKAVTHSFVPSQTLEMPETIEEGKVLVLRGQDENMLLDYVSDRFRKENVERASLSFFVSYNEQWEQTNIQEDTDGYTSKRKENPLLTALQEGKTVVFSHLHQNDELLSDLGSLLLPDPYLLVNGERIFLRDLKGRVVLIDKRSKLHPKSVCDVQELEGVIRKDLLLKQFEGLTEASYNTLTEIIERLSTTPKPADKEFPADIGQTYERYVQVLKQIDFTKDKTTPRSWYRAIMNVFGEAYAEAPEIQAFLSVQCKMLLGYNPQKANTVHQANLDEVLSQLNPRDTLEDVYWQLMDTVSTDRLKTLYVEPQFKTTTHKGLDIIKQALGHLTTDTDWRAFWKAKYPQAKPAETDDKLGWHARLKAPTLFRWQLRFNRGVEILKNYSALMLKGPPGRGKTFLCDKIAKKLGYAQDEMFGPIGLGTDATYSTLFSAKDGALSRWAESEKGILFVDEANLPKEGFWNLFRGVFTDKPSIILNGKRFDLSPSHKIIFTGNQDRLPNRTQHEFIREFFVTLTMPDFENEFLDPLILNEYLNSSSLEVETQQELSVLAIQLFRLLETMTQSESLSLRDIEEMLARSLRINRSDNPKTNLLYAFQEVTTLGCDEEMKAAINEVLSIKYPQDYKPLNTSYLDLEDTFHTIATYGDKISLNDQSRAMMASTHHFIQSDNKGKSLLIFQGEPGVGKDVIAAATLRASGYIDYAAYLALSSEEQAAYNLSKKVFFHENASTDYDPIFEKIDIARTKGFKFILSEPNVLPSGILEGKLNEALTDKLSQNGFSVIMTMNSLDLKGRERFSSALINRSIFHRLRPYTEAENAALVMDLYGFDEGLANRLADAHEGFIGATTRELKLAAKALKAASSNEGDHFDAIIDKVYGLRCKRRLKLNTPLSVRTLQLVARAMTPQRRIEGVKKDIAIGEFNPTDAPDKAGFFREEDYSYSLREGSENNPQELKNTTYHEMGHAAFSREWFKDTPLHQKLEDFRISLAQRINNEGIGYLANEEGLATLCQSIISQDWVAILNTEPTALFVNILAAYGLPEIGLTQDKVAALHKNALEILHQLDKNVAQRLTPILIALEFAMKDEVFENAKIAIASIPAKPKYATLPSEVEVQKTSFIAHQARLKLEPYFNQIPRDLEQIRLKSEEMMAQAIRDKQQHELNKEQADLMKIFLGTKTVIETVSEATILSELRALRSSGRGSASPNLHHEPPESLFAAARLDPKYSHISDDDLWRLVNEVLGTTNKPRNIPVKVLTEQSSTELVPFSMDRSAAPPRQKPPLRERITARLLQNMTWLPERAFTSTFDFDKQYVPHGGTLDPNQLLFDPSNAYIRSGGSQKRSRRPLVIYDKSMKSLSPLVEDALDAMFRQGITATVVTGKNQMVQDISSIADLRQAMAIRNECDDDSVKRIVGSNAWLTGLTEFQSTIEAAYMAIALEEEGKLDSREINKNPAVPQNILSASELESKLGKIAGRVSVLGNSSILQIFLFEPLNERQIVEVMDILECQPQKMELFIYNTLTWDDIKHIGRLSQLISLYFVDKSLTSIDSIPVEQLPNLRFLMVNDKLYDKAELDKLRQERIAALAAAAPVNDPDAEAPLNPTLKSIVSRLIHPDDVRAKLEEKFRNNEEIFALLERLFSGN